MSIFTYKKRSFILFIIFVQFSLTFFIRIFITLFSVFDSSAKISSGILNGNVNYLGDFDQCINVEGPIDNIRGKYCLTYLQTSISDNLPKYKRLHNLVQSYGAFKSEFDDVSIFSI